MSGVTDWVEGDISQQEAPSSPAWSEELSEELWDRIEGVRHKLTRILNPAKFTPYLRQCKVIDEQDEDEVLNSTQYPMRISKAGRLLDILHGQGHRGLQAFMEALEFYHPDQYIQLTGKQPTQRCSLILDEEGPEGLTQFLLLEVRKLREQLRNSRLCERRLSQRCRMAEEERSRAERKAQELRHDKLLLERLRQDWESASRELGKLKDRHLEQAVKYSRALEEQSKASSRERELLRQVEELKSRLTEADKQTSDPPKITRTNSLHSNGTSRSPPALPESLLQQNKAEKTEKTSDPSTGVIALMDILQQDRREAAEQRQELCDFIARLQGELQSAEELRDKLESQWEQLQLKVRTLQLDWETEQKRSMTYFNQIMELEKERDQALCSRDSLQLEYTDCLQDKNRLRKRIAELQANLEQQQRDLERERERSREQLQQNACLHCSHLSLCSEDQCFGPCCSVDLDLSPHSNISHLMLRKTPSNGQTHENSGDSCSTSEENLLSSTKDDEKEINRLSTFAFPPCMNSINRRCNIEFDLDSWGSDENDNILGDQSEPSLWDSWTSVHSHLFPPDLVNLPSVSNNQPNPNAPRKPSSLCSPTSSPPTSPKHGRDSLADDITIVGGNLTGIFVSHVNAGSPAEQYGLKEGSELLELERVLFGGGSVMLNQCTAEVAHFSLQWWTELSALKHQSNPDAYSKLCSKLSSPSFCGADSFYVRVNLNMEPRGDPPSLGVSCNDIIHVTDTRHNGNYHWCCSLVDLVTGKPLQTGTMPNYNRAQQLLLVRLRKMSLDQKDFKKKMFAKKPSGRVRLVKAVDPSCRAVGTSQSVVYTLSKRQEDHLIPYTLVQPVKVQTKRPVIFSPSLLSRGLIERLLQPVESGLKFNTCPPEPIPALERQDKKVFLLDSSSPEQPVGIRLESIQEVISQDRHCLLELGLPSVEGLLRQGIYPIIIHIRPKNKKHKKLRKFFPRCGEDSVMEDACRSEELHLETLPMLYYTLEPSTWSCTEELLKALCDAIHSQQGAVAWVELDRLQ
ncbi:caspase recruitment domain-containing protein 10 [Kryptolebias marmoratus]|uniref:Caspase recruitment domain family member 10 n=1 Tax=Kryptolebias marmoratus TaxID=37003 RepID=A0A3Q3ASI5_KRYMA|nr:caspase recruitment domain-containing protein 10 [Kryptolebias marmoratus]